MSSNYSTSLVFLEGLAGYIICGLIGIFGLIVAWRMFTGKIDIGGLLAEKDGKASMSRLQLLIFTFVIAFSFFLVVISNIKILQARGGASGAADLPDVPNGVLGLLGISASSYAVSKAIQHGTGTGGSDDEAAKEKKEG
jgi:hypothetical protein